MSDKASATAILGVMLFLLGLGLFAVPQPAVQPPNPPAVTAPTQPAPAPKPVTLAPVPAVSTAAPTTNFTPPLAVLPPGYKPLSGSMLQFKGGFRVDKACDGWSYGGLALRKKADGTKTLLFSGQPARYSSSGNWGQATHEIAIATPTLDLSGPRAALLYKWDDIFAGHRLIPGWAPGGGNGYLQTEGIKFAGGLLFGTYGKYYDVTNDNNPVLVACKLNDDNTVTGYGPWMTDVNSHRVRQWGIDIPRWFADKYTGGQTFGLGAGIAAGSGQSSYGPDLYAAVAPTPATPALTGIVQTRLLAYYPPSPVGQRQPRAADYQPAVANATLFPAPVNGSGFWTGNDFIGGAAWIDIPPSSTTPGVSGALYCTRPGLNWVWYGLSPFLLSDGVTSIVDACGGGHGVHASAYCQRWQIWHPGSFAAVTTGVAPSWQVGWSEMFDATSRWPMPLLSCDCLATGVTFDADTNTLYVMCPKAEPRASLNGGPLPVVYVWQVTPQ